jgi:hypothetical protein
MTILVYGVQSGFPEVITFIPDSAVYSKKDGMWDDLWQ